MLPQELRTSAGHHVLVVDDDPAVRSLLRGLLEDDGMQVTQAEHGAEALQCLALAPRAFDAIVLDLSMPVMDGRQFYQRLRADGHADVPVLILSAAEARRAQRELGAAAAIEKPFDIDRFSSAMRRLIDVR